MVKEVMGHENLKTTMGYLHPETAQIKVVIDRLNQQKYVMERWSNSHKNSHSTKKVPKRMGGGRMQVA